MKIRPAEAEVSHADRQTEKHDVTNSCSRNSANDSKNKETHQAGKKTRKKKERKEKEKT